jgi:ribosomal protein S18 acetylase RimI-like enzyme
MNYLSRDEWLGRILNEPTYAVKYTTVVSSAAGEGSATGFPSFVEIEEIRRKELRSFFYVKVPTSEVPNVALFESVGFHLIDTNVTLTKHLDVSGEESQPNNAYSIGPAQEDDLEDVSTLAGSAFEYSRFHLDPQISKALAQNIKREWARNFFLGQRGDHMVVCRHKGVVIGFVLLLQPLPSELVIDLIAVNAGFRSKGIGRLMLEHVSANFRGVKTIVVGTQVCNVGSLALYQKCRFFITSSSYVLHGHFRQDGNR